MSSPFCARARRKPIVVDLGTDPARSAQADIQILPGDKILISRVGVVYVLGAFRLQGAIPLQQTSPLTLMQATALSGGAGFEGKFEDLRIVRTVGLTRSVVTVNIKRVLDGKDPDPVLQADDIVFLPPSAFQGGDQIGWDCDSREPCISPADCAAKPLATYGIRG